VQTPTRPIPIAIVIVCRNACEALNRTLDSIRAVNDPRVLPVVIDGASSDATPALLRSFEDWAFYACSEPDSGIYDAMNKGWRACPHNAHVLYLGAGDLLRSLPTTGELVDRAGNPWPVVLGCCDVGITAFQSRWGVEMRLRNTAHHQALMVHRSTALEPPFDPALRVYGDWDFNLRLMDAGHTAHFVDSLRTYAEPGGASWRHDLSEIALVARRHSGPLVAAAAYALNRWSLWRRERGHGR
jgi:glycosyltransferase involved in cell wall biosynthesis